MHEDIYRHFFGPLRSNITIAQAHELLNRAAQEGVVFDAVDTYKGITYEAKYDGYILSYHLGHDDAYRANSEIHIMDMHENDLNDIDISPMPCPNFLKNDEWFLQLLEAFANKYSHLVLDFGSRSWRHNMLEQIHAVVLERS